MPVTRTFARLADRLLEAGKIEQEKHDEAVAQLAQNGGRMEEALLDVGAIGEVDLLKFLATFYKTRFVSTEKLSKADIDPSTLDLVPRSLAEKHQVLPVLFDAEASLLSVVSADPDDAEALRDVAMVARVKEVRAFVARPAAVRAAIAKTYGGDIHAFAAIDRTAHEQFASMLDVYERNLLSDEQIAKALVETPARERTLSAESIASSVRPSKAAPSSVAGPSNDVWLETLNVLVTLVENARAELRGHSAHVARICRKLCERVGIAEVETMNVVAAAYLHDLGKMGAYHLTPFNVSEYDGHRVAAEKAYQAPRRLMEACALSPTTIAAIETMYERYDGKGLPGQTAGKEIPLGGRILAIADTYADLTQNSRNPFRKALRPVEACEVLGRYKGTVFDPNLVDLFRIAMTGDDVKGRLLGDRHVALLVDPDPEETTVLELRLIQQGFVVRTARTTDAALRAIEAGDVEIVVSELEVPPDDGFALLEEVRRSAAGRDLLWMFLTRKVGRAEAQRAFELGVVDVVGKPVNADVLGTKMKQAVELRAPATSPRGVAGSLSEMALPDIVQVLSHGRKSGSLRVRSGESSGEIHFVDGQIFDALWGKLRGEEAFYAMLTLQEGDFALSTAPRAQTRVIERTPEELLLEGMRRLDEGLANV